MGATLTHASLGYRTVPQLRPDERAAAPPLPQGQLTAEKVPPAQRAQPMNLARLLMPLVMVAAVGAMVTVMVVSGGELNPMTMVFPLMMVMGMVSMMQPPGEDADETRRAYVRQLAVLRGTALRNAEEQRSHLEHCHPEPNRLWEMVWSPRLWERSAADADATDIRIGRGPTALCTPIDVPDSGAPEDIDPVCAMSLRRLTRAVSTVPDLPVVVKLAAFRYVAISGPRAADLLRAMLAHLVFHHGPETLGVHVCSAFPESARCYRRPGEVSEWQWLRWIPHTRAPQEAKYRVLVLDGVGDNAGVEAFDDPEWDLIIGVVGSEESPLRRRSEDEGLALYADSTVSVFTASGWEEVGRPDSLTPREALVLARRLTRCRRPQEGGSSHASETFLRGLGIPPSGVLDPATMWPGQRGAQRLKATVGWETSGTKQSLTVDLKESAHGGMGPHGLCIGATGSGKSELLRTLVVDLIATHSPDEVNLVLVDFKGGATFLGLEGAPHTSAVITNLADEAVLVARMRDAISGEMNRRQEVLRRAGNYANVDDYTAARDAGTLRSDEGPLPALLIVVDEFSELLGQHPDFAELFVAIGRLGRSLHVHLLLASQRLEEGRLRGLESHLSYRIGLRTFSSAESRHVLGIPDAATLPSRPGMGFLRSDVGEVTQFQAAYVSGSLPRSSGKASAIAPVTFFRSWEDIQVSEETPVEEDHSTTVLETVVSSAITAAKNRGMRAHRVWLPPLPEAVELANLAENSSGLRVAMGIIDRPYHQRQDPWFVDYSVAGGHYAVCGGPRSGKSTSLATAVCAVAAANPPDVARFYVLDFGGSLGFLARLPHVSGVAGRSDPERARRILDEVLYLMGRPIPTQHVFLVVDGWHTLYDEFEDFLPLVNRIATDGPGTNVHLMLSTSRWTLVRPAVRDLISHRLELKLGEALDSLIDRKSQMALPVAPGRGLSTDNEQLLVARSSPQDVAYLAKRSAQRGEAPAPALKVLPERVSFQELTAPPAGVALGRGGPQLETVVWDPAAHHHLLVVGSRGSGKTTALTTILRGIAGLGRSRARIVLIDQRRSHLGAVPESMLAAYAGTSEATKEALAALITTLRGRLPGPHVTPAELAARSWWEGPEIYLVIEDADLVTDPHHMGLTELISHSVDIGLHVIVAHKAGGIGRALYQPFLSTLKDQAPSLLLLDSDKEEGPVLGVKPVHQPPGRAQWVPSHDEGITLQVAVVGNEEDEDTPQAEKSMEELS